MHAWVKFWLAPLFGMPRIATEISPAVKVESHLELSPLAK